MPTRREFLKWTAAGGVGLVAGRGLVNGQAWAAPVARTASVAGSLTPYLDPMPILADNAIDATGGPTTVGLSTALIRRKLHSQLPETPLFGYLGGPNDGRSYLGPVIVAKAGVTVTVNYRNGLAGDDYLRVFTNPLGSSYGRSTRSPRLRSGC